MHCYVDSYDMREYTSQTDELEHDAMSANLWDAPPKVVLTALFLRTI